MNKLIFISCLLLIATTIYAQQTTSGILENIERVKERLGDKLLTTADGVIARHVEAVGGREAIGSIKTLVVKGRILFGSGNPNLYRYYKQPNNLRVSRLLENESYIITDGDKVWSVTPQGRKELNAWWTKSLSHQRIDGNFIDYKCRGIAYEYLGLNGFKSEPFVYYHLRRTFLDGFIEELYFNVETGLLHCLWKTSSPRKNDPEFYYDYRKIGGILIPHMWVTVFDNVSSPHVLVIEEVKINKDFGEDFFTEYKEKPIQK